jgi:hypothetical protein
MRIIRGDSEFEISICLEDGEWEGCLIEHHISRLTPTMHLRHRWISLEAALTGVQRRWQRLFPDQDVPDFRGAVAESLPLDDPRARDLAGE